MRRLTFAALVIIVTACGSSPAAPSPGAASTSATTSGTTPPPTAALPACAAWAAAQRPTGVPDAVGARVAYRNNLYAAGGGVRAVGPTSYAVWFPSGWTAGAGRVIVGLHGTGGSGEEDWWFNWRGHIEERGYAYVGLTYLSPTGVFDDEPTAYANLTAALDTIKASCDFGSPSMFLVGFSRGSAMTFGMAYLDLHGRRFFQAFGHNSGAWPAGEPMTATLSGFAARGETTAYAGGRFWMYCGERDNAHGAPMCDEMANARTFVVGYGGSVAELFRDPTGGHGGLNANPTALASMYAYFDALR